MKELSVRLPQSHPCLATLRIDVEDWYRFQQLTGDAAEIHILGREPAGNGMLWIDVACTDDIVRERIENAWG